MTCKDCIHNDVCMKKYNHMYESYSILDAVNIENVCKTFKDKSKFIELPCKVGDIVYVMEYADDKIVDYSGYIFIMANKDFAFLSSLLNEEENPIEICNIYFQRYIENYFCPTSGIIVPLSEIYTKDEAEEKLKELNKNGRRKIL